MNKEVVTSALSKKVEEITECSIHVNIHSYKTVKR